MKRFEGKVAIVTGGYQGIGLGIVKRLLSEDAKVVYCGRSQEKIDAVQGELGENALGVVCDVRNEEQIRNMLNVAVEAFGKVDVLVNNAGIIRRITFKDMPISDLDECYETNVKGTVLASQVLANYWIENGIKGVIVNTGSINSLVGSPGIPAYCASKGAVLLLTKGMANRSRPVRHTRKRLRPGHHCVPYNGRYYKQPREREVLYGQAECKALGAA